MADVHPDLRHLARLSSRPRLGPWTLPLVRLAMRWINRRGRNVEGVEALTLPSGVGIRLHRPPTSAAPAPALLWLHGGGYVTGSPVQDDASCQAFARELGAIVVAVHYRLAPEHPYPAALEDCYAALTWLARLPTVDVTRVAVGGASAGGGLAAALALLARDRAEVDVAAQVLVYPMLDDRSGQGDDDGPPHPMWSRASNRWGWSCYLGGADPNVAVPARREDLSRLPPAWIGVGTVDLFHDENVEYAQRLRRAGVSCELEVVPGAFHGFDKVAAKATMTRDFDAKQLAFLRGALNPAGSDARPAPDR